MLLRNDKKDVHWVQNSEPSSWLCTVGHYNTGLLYCWYIIKQSGCCSRMTFECASLCVQRTVGIHQHRANTSSVQVDSSFSWSQDPRPVTDWVSLKILDICSTAASNTRTVSRRHRVYEYACTTDLVQHKATSLHHLMHAVTKVSAWADGHLQKSLDWT